MSKVEEYWCLSEIETDYSGGGKRHTFTIFTNKEKMQEKMDECYIGHLRDRYCDCRSKEIDKLDNICEQCDGCQKEMPKKVSEEESKVDSDDSDELGEDDKYNCNWYCNECIKKTKKPTDYFICDELELYVQSQKSYDGQDYLCSFNVRC